MRHRIKYLLFVCKVISDSQWYWYCLLPLARHLQETNVSPPTSPFPPCTMEIDYKFHKVWATTQNRLSHPGEFIPVKFIPVKYACARFEAQHLISFRDKMGSPRVMQLHFVLLVDSDSMTVSGTCNFLFT